MPVIQRRAEAKRGIRILKCGGGHKNPVASLRNRLLIGLRSENGLSLSSIRKRKRLGASARGRLCLGVAVRNRLFDVGRARRSMIAAGHFIQLRCRQNFRHRHLVMVI